MAGASRLGDKAQVQQDSHGCPGCPHPGVGPAISGSSNVMINGRPAVRVDDVGIHAVCCGPNMWSAAEGSSTVFVNGKPLARQNDKTRHCGGQGKMIEGSNDVIVGGSPSSSGNSAGAASGGGGSGTGGSGGSSDSGAGTASGAASSSGGAAAAKGSGGATAQGSESASPAQSSSKTPSLTAAQWVVSGDLFAGDSVKLRATALDLSGAPTFEIHAATDDRVLATVSGSLKGTTAEAQWTTTSDFDEAAAHDASRAPKSLDLYFIVKLGGKEAKSDTLPLNPLRHLNLKLLDAPSGSLQFVVTHSGGTQRISASGQLDAVLRTTDTTCTIDFGKGPIQVAFDMPPLSDPRGLRLRLTSLGYQAGDDDNPYAPPFVLAVARFQTDEGLNLSGKIDEDTRTALKRRFGF